VIAPSPRPNPRLAVFAPSPVLTITAERADSSRDDIHVHAGGQGFWVARMAAVLGADVTLCAPLGGESGAVLGELIRREGVTLQAVSTPRPNGAYIHDRRSGRRAVVAQVESPALARHELDELYGAMVAVGLRSDAALLTGPQHERVLAGDVYRRLASDLRRNGIPVIADLTGAPLEGALTGGVDVLKLSSAELAELVDRPLDSIDDVAVEALELHRRGAAGVVVSRAEEPALALIDGALYVLEGPTFEPLDERGAGDSFVAGLSVGISRGLGLREASKLGVAAGALNVTRRGLGSGRREDIEEVAGLVKVHELTRLPS
jgi:1-phosphofructokinase